MLDVVVLEAAIITEKFTGTTAECRNEETVVEAIFQRLNTSEKQRFVYE